MVEEVNNNDGRPGGPCRVQRSKRLRGQHGSIVGVNANNVVACIVYTTPIAPTAASVTAVVLALVVQHKIRKVQPFGSVSSEWL